MEDINLKELDKNSPLGETVPEGSLINYPSPNNPPWGIPAAIGLWLFSVLLIVVLPSLFLIPYLMNAGIKISDAEALTDFALTDPTAVLIQISAVIPAHIITLLLAFFIVTKFKEFSFKETLGWDWGGYKWWHNIVLIVSVFAVAVAASQIFGTHDNDFLRMLRSSRYVVFVVAFMATFSAPIVEEVVYRGVLYSAFQRTFNIPVAIFLVTAVFALVHYPQYWGDPATIITLTFLSLLITMIRVKTNSLLPCIFFHFLINGVQSIMLILEPYLPKALDTTPIEGFFYLIQ